MSQLLDWLGHAGLGSPVGETSRIHLHGELLELTMLGEFRCLIHLLLLVFHLVLLLLAQRASRLQPESSRELFGLELVIIAFNGPDPLTAASVRR